MRGCSRCRRSDSPRPVMSMRELLRRMALIARMSIRTDPLRSLGALAEPLGGVFQMLLGLWVKLLVDGVMRHDEARAVTGAVCIAASMLLYFGTGLLGNLARVALAERVGFAFDRQIAEMTARIPSLEPFERADYADELQILRQNRALLGGSLNSLLYTFTTALRAITAVVMLTAVDPRLLLLLAAAVPAVIGARLRYRWDKAAEDASASHGRLARHLIRLAAPGCRRRAQEVGDHRVGQCHLRRGAHRRDRLAAGRCRPPQRLPRDD